MTDRSNDNDASTVARIEGPDAHGQAAILLVESLIHALVARSVITGSDAIDLVTVAFDVKMEIAADRGDQVGSVDKTLALLSSIRETLRVDFA